MRFVGIEAVAYGVTNLPKARRFWTDFGLEERPAGKASAVFAAEWMLPKGLPLRKTRGAG